MPTSKTASKYAPKVLPDPEAVALLGTLYELRVRESDGRTVVHEWPLEQGPGLLWSPTARALFAFPGVRYDDWVELQRGTTPERGERLDMRETKKALADMGYSLPPSTQAAAKLFTEWAARPSTRFTQKRIAPHKLSKSGSGTNLKYRSDKWNGRNGQRVNYTHDMAKSGSDIVSMAKGHPPKAIFIKGPRLTVNARGIIY